MQDTQDTLLSDLDTSIKFWYALYVLSNTILVIASAVVIVLPMLTVAGFVDQKWGFLSGACGALLAYLGLSGVSASFIKARNDTQVAKYRYNTDKDREKLIAAYEKAKALASYVPSAPPTTDKDKQQTQSVDKDKQQIEPAGT